MGQSEYAQNFIKVMLGWIRQLASSIAGTFQTASGSLSASGGMTAVTWFADHWLGLLITLIVIGVFTDWMVWMLRWRPYWAWFHKRRVLLDDDIDQVLTEEEMKRRYQADREETRDTRFHSKALRRRDAAQLDEDDLNEAFFPDEEEEDETLAYVDVPDDEEGEIFASRDAEQQEEAEAGPPARPTESREAVRRGRFGRILPLYHVRSEDPFDADGQEFSDLDDDFLNVVSEEPDQPIRRLSGRLSANEPQDSEDEDDDDVFGDGNARKRGRRR